MQQVNLYQKELRPRQVPFAARTMLLATGAWLAVLLVLFGVGRWRQSRLEQQLAAANADVAVASQHLAKLEAQYPLKTKDPVLAREVERLAAARDGRSALLGQLEGKTLGNVSGFSPQLLAFARETVSGLWLQRIALDQGGRELTLEGSALTATTVPRYLKRLAGEPVFSGMEFETFRLSRPQSAPRQVDFFLETRKSDSAKHR